MKHYNIEPKTIEIAMLIAVVVFCLIFAFAMHGAPNKTPVITSILPTCLDARGIAQTLTVNGYNFTGRSVVYVNSSPRPTVYLSSAQITAQLTAADAAQATQLAIVVVNDKPRATSSNMWSLSVITPVLKIFSQKFRDGQQDQAYTFTLDAGHVSGCTGARID